MSKTPLTQHRFLAGACISLHIPAFSKCNRWGDSSALWEQSWFFPSLLAFPSAFHDVLPCHPLFSSPSEIACMGEFANPTQSAMSNSQLLITCGCFGELCEIWLVFSSPQFTFLCPCAYTGAKKKETAMLPLLQNPRSKPNIRWHGENHPACNLVGVLIGGGNSAIHWPAELSPGPVWGRVSEEDGTLRGCAILLHPLRLGIRTLLDELQLRYRWT